MDKMHAMHAEFGATSVLKIFSKTKISQSSKLKARKKKKIKLISSQNLIINLSTRDRWAELGRKNKGKKYN